MKRYFIAECDKEGQPTEDSIFEVPAPPLLLVFAVGVLIGVIVTILFR
jgi:hypothetical protein